MKRSTLIAVGIIAVVVFVIGGFYLTRYSRQSTLKTALNISELPSSLKILDYSDEGVSTFRAKYELSLDSAQFGELVKGRTYEMRIATYQDLPEYTTRLPKKGFTPAKLYVWASEKNRTMIYSNFSKSLVYLIWDAE